MNQSKSLLKNTFIYTIGNLGSKLLTFSLLPILSFYLSKKELGEYDVVLTTISMFVPFVSLQISDAAYKWLLNREAEDYDALRSKIITNGLLIIIVTSVIFLAAYFTVGAFVPLNYKYHFAAILLSSIFLPYFQQVTRGLQKNKLYAIAGLSNAVFVLGFNILFLIGLKMKLEALFLALIIANFATCIILVQFSGVYKFINFKLYSTALQKQMLKYCLPLIPNSISWWLVNAADKFLILYYLGVNSNGIYAISSRLPSIITILNTIFILAWQDHSMTSKDSSIDSKTFDRFYTFELSFVLVLISASKIIVEGIVSSSFIDAYKYMPMLFIGAAYSAFSAYFGAYYLKSGNTKGIFVTSIAGGVTNIVVVLLLIKHIGLYSSALGTFLSFMVMFVYRYIDLKKEINLKVNMLKLISLTVLCVVFSLALLIHFKYINYILLVLAIGIFLFLNSEVIVKLKKMVFK
ncbi:O-antigen/teichoic acid export membrane protein [Mucilaginibacter sp. UYNi724]